LQASLLFTVITAIASETPAEKLRRWHIVVAICAVGFAAGVLIFVPVSAISFKEIVG
jgi:high-affinity Fe2+/Pb2+ permease